MVSALHKTGGIRRKCWSRNGNIRAGGETNLVHRRIRHADFLCERRLMQIVAGELVPAMIISLAQNVSHLFGAKAPRDSLRTVRSLYRREFFWALLIVHLAASWSQLERFKTFTQVLFIHDAWRRLCSRKRPLARPSFSDFYSLQPRVARCGNQLTAPSGGRRQA